MPEDVDLPHYLRMIAAAIAALAGLYYLLSRRGKDAFTSADTEASISSSDWRPALDRHSSVPRHLPENPFSGSENLADFCIEIEDAAKASALMSRAVGLIYFEFPKLVSGAATGEASIGALADDFRLALRPTDHVALLGQDQIVVVVCLLACRKDLETVASRLSAAARRRGAIEEGAPSLPVGLAMYPSDGLEGQALIDAARKHYRDLWPTKEKPETPAAGG
ncbi:hypothetical protein OGR47_05425 [Methylocystis sp. MJC1]|jgi:hypothetical protein|uniref:hypothetical protein n=1 Tax=Methylocystis sp. MJC1 TaxID=2654282 RepID=UPI0013EB6D5C|nr:hypothetical protein [Methylocystis sp. MJC1]KAF2992466.1 hypothetical protein MJC1_00042 [Methylocystis sp. MJC1]MBU6526444.1 hypothetical protein [Methylocystis sp. MJC1]UZX12886.1 hypothetical protein OGR47_05425 [Methylocystis sp. MJC1]